MAFAKYDGVVVAMENGEAFALFTTGTKSMTQRGFYLKLVP
jgi:hypothetical protein